MPRPTLLEGMLLALLSSLLCGPLLLFLQSLVGGLLAWKALLLLLTCAYLGYLLLRSPRQSGRLSLGLLALSALLSGLLLQMRFSSLLLMSLTLIWGLRSLAYSRSLLSAALQGGLCLIGCGAARLLYEHSGSLTLSLWGFLLTQAAFVLIPARLPARPERPGNTPTDDPQERFGQAQQVAIQALSRLQRSAR
ncbi:MAG: hypothetical protein AB7N91_25885 [Candidatus Tectimicrobiota bacterium]